MSKKKKKESKWKIIPTPEDVDKIHWMASQLLPMIPELESVEIKYKELTVKLKSKSDY